MANKKDEEAVKVSKERPMMQTGCDLLDLVLGGDKGVYGLPYGYILNIIGDKSAGKAAPLTTHVLTPRGWKLMGDIKVGDIVCTPVNGESAPVLGVYPQGKRDVYRFHFNDGTTADTADMHLWVMQTANQYSSDSSYGLGKGSYTLTTKEIADVYATDVKSADRLALPMVDPVTFDSGKKLKVPPYLLGLLIADGGMTTSTPVITNPEKDIVEKATALAKSVGLTLNRKNDSISYGVVQAKELHGRSWLPKYMRDMGLNCKSSEKHIPEAYMLASIRERLELLHGIFDGDGHVSKGGNLVYTTTSKRLADDVADLCRSLGMRATLSHPKRNNYMKDGHKVECLDSYDVNIVSPGLLLPFSSRKHFDRYHASGREYIKAHRILQRVEYIGKQECQCIYIGHPSHLYIMDDYIPTHNTFLKNEIMAFNHYKFKSGDVDFKHRSDDGESGDTFDTKRLYGVDLSSSNDMIGKVKFNNSNTVEEFSANVDLFLEQIKDGDVGVYALDSLDGLSDAADLDDMDELVNQMKLGKDVKQAGSYGATKPKFLSKFFRTHEKTLFDKMTNLIIVSQIRDKIDSKSYGPKWSVSAGKALEFYCHTRLFLRTKRKITVGSGDNERVIGAVVEVEAIKSKTPRPYRKCIYTIYFQKGIDNVGSNIDYLYGLLSEKYELLKSSESISWGGVEVNLKSVGEWLDSNGYRDSYDAYAREKYGNKRLNTDVAREWATTVPEALEKWNSHFGKIMTRDELRKLCQENKEERMKLRQLVREKWERIEGSAESQIGFEKQFDID